jgi:hypothetical protein
MTQRKVLPIASIPGGGSNRPIELPHFETFPGAACCQPIELPSYKAAPLQAFGPLNTRRVCNPSGFLPHPSSALVFRGYSSSTAVVPAGLCRNANSKRCLGIAPCRCGAHRKMLEYGFQSEFYYSYAASDLSRIDHWCSRRRPARPNVRHCRSKNGLPSAHLRIHAG